MTVQSTPPGDFRRLGDQIAQGGMKRRIGRFLDMVAVPQTRTPHTLTRGIKPKPIPRRRIDTGIDIAAQQSDRVSFDETAQAPGARLILHRQSDDAHFADASADCSLQRAFHITNLSRRSVFMAPGFDPDYRRSHHHRIAKQFAEHGSTVISARRFNGSAVRPQTAPKCRLRSPVQCMRADPHDARSISATGACLSGLEKEIDPPIGPPHPRCRGREGSSPPSMALKIVQERIEILRGLSPVHASTNLTAVLS